jgi:cell division protein FtsA
MMANRSNRDELIVGLDIGTTKVCALVGERTADGVNIIGYGMARSEGLKKGVVVDIERTVDSIIQAIEEAEHMAGCQISSVFVGIAGADIRGENSTGSWKVENREVNPRDVTKVIELAKNIPVPDDRQVFHIFPQEYTVDRQPGIKNPVGMTAQRLEAKVHVVTGSRTSAQNLISCVTKADLQAADIVLQPLASADAVLFEDEKELGVVVIDIGGGTTDIVVYLDGSIVHTAVLTLGGDHVTADIATGLHTSISDAEEIKKKHGCALPSLVGPEEVIEVASLGDRRSRQLPRSALAHIIEPRLEEMFQLVMDQLTRNGYHELLASGAVITGGATLMAGTDELASRVLNMAVRRGSPKGVGGLLDVVDSPIFSTGVGLVLYGDRHDHASPFRTREPGLASRLKGGFRTFLKDMFG